MTVIHLLNVALDGRQVTLTRTDVSHHVSYWKMLFLLSHWKICLAFLQLCPQESRNKVGDLSL